MKRFAILLVLAVSMWAHAQSPPSQATGYQLVWEDTFASLSLTTSNVGGFNWYNPGLYGYSADGAITDPSNTYVNLNWLSTQGSYYTNMSTASMNGAFYHAWTPPLYLEVSAAFNPVLGQWPAFWMLSVAQNQVGSAWSTNGNYYPEIDLFEWDYTGATRAESSVHTWQNGVDVGNNIGSNSYALPAGIVLSNFNTYGVLWTPSQITWYINNQQVLTFSTTSSPYNKVFGGQYAMFLILSEQSGCKGTYGPSQCGGPTESPTNLQVQWAHVFQGPLGSVGNGVQQGALVQ